MEKTQYVTVVNYLRKGKDGVDGEDAVEITVSPDTLVFSTNDKGEIDISSLAQSAQIKVYQGGEDITRTCTFSDKNAKFVNASGYVSQMVQGGSAVGLVTFSAVGTSVTVDGHKIPYTVGYASIDIPCAKTGKVYKTQVKFNVDGGTFWGGLSSTSKGLQASYTEISGRMDDMDSDVSGLKDDSTLMEKRVGSLEVSSRQISLKVSQTAIRDRNLIPNSYLMAGTAMYGFGMRNVWLEANKSYAFTVWGKISKEAQTNGCTLSAFVFKLASDGSWLWQQRVDISSTSETSATVKFTVPQSIAYKGELGTYTESGTGDYKVMLYPYPQDKSVLVFARCMQLEEISDINGEASDWTFGKNDPTAYGNLLPSVTRGGQWNIGGTLTERGFVADGHTVNVVYATALKTILSLSGYLSMVEGETYTLSFWAKGKGSMTVGMGNACTYAIASNGRTSQSSGGTIAFSLTSEWTRYWVTWTAGAPTSPTATIVLMSGIQSEAYVAAVKLDPYGRATAYTDISIADMLATGIDILGGIINVTANQFNIQNNQGKRTFSVDADGMVTMDRIMLGGMINKTGVNVPNLATLQALFTNEVDPLGIDLGWLPKLNNMYGIYYFTGTTGKTPQLRMPCAYVDEDGYFTGDVFDENGELSLELLRKVRAMVGNTVLIYNDSQEDIKVEYMSSYFEDIWVKDSSSRAARVAGTVTTPSSGAVAPDQNSGYDKVTASGGIYPDQRYAGKRRVRCTDTLTGGKHGFISLTCVCETGEKGWENIYWTGNKGQGFNT